MSDEKKTVSGDPFEGLFGDDDASIRGEIKSQLERQEREREEFRRNLPPSEESLRAAADLERKQAAERVRRQVPAGEER